MIEVCNPLLCLGESVCMRGRWLGPPVLHAVLGLGIRHPEALFACHHCAARWRDAEAPGAFVMALPPSTAQALLDLVQQATDAVKGIQKPAVRRADDGSTCPAADDFVLSGRALHVLHYGFKAGLAAAGALRTGGHVIPPSK